MKKTPELLPVLKEAGVADSGETRYIPRFSKWRLRARFHTIALIPAGGGGAEAAEEFSEAVDIPDTFEIKYGYCTELFVINLFNPPTDEEIDKLREKLSRIGDSVVVAFDEGFIKLHVHTSAPGKVLQLGLCLGELDKIN